MQVIQVRLRWGEPRVYTEVQIPACVLFSRVWCAKSVVPCLWVTLLKEVAFCHL